MKTKMVHCGVLLSSELRVQYNMVHTLLGSTAIESPHLNNFVGDGLQRLPCPLRNRRGHQDHQWPSDAPVLPQRVNHDLSADRKLVIGDHRRVGFMLDILAEQGAAPHTAGGPAVANSTAPANLKLPLFLLFRVQGPRRTPNGEHHGV